MNPAFYDKDFWLLFKTLENENITEEKIEMLQSQLEEDFVIEEEDEELPPTVKFSFDCGPRYSLELDILLDSETDKNLSLIHKQTGEEYTLGWWDLARWHPYCLRLEELEYLCNYWRRHDDRWKDTQAWLLLSDFAGITTKQEGEKLRALDTVSLRENGCYDTQLISSLLPENTTRESLLAGEAYNWILTPDLGWVFRSDEYNCYSIRNREHLGSNCGDFPFQQWREMLEDIGLLK